MGLGRVRLAAALLAGAALCGCVARTHQENAALRMAYPGPPGTALMAYSPPSAAYPSIGGDILKGSSPAELAAAREAASHPQAPEPNAFTPKPQ